MQENVFVPVIERHAIDKHKRLGVDNHAEAIIFDFRVLRPYLACVFKLHHIRHATARTIRGY